MNEQTKCPKCGAEEIEADSLETEFKCGSFVCSESREFFPSNECRISELEKENERLKAREVAMVQADPRQLWNLATFDLLAMLRKVLDSAHPHPVENPGMYAAWQEASALLQKKGEG